MVDAAIMRDKHTGKSRGFAFVTFRERSKAGVQVLNRKLLHPSSPHLIGGRQIEIREGDGSKPSDSFLERSNSSSGSKTNNNKGSSNS